MPAAPATPIDTPGAGDALAGGFLHGITPGLDLEASAAQGVKLAARVISRYGARP